MNSFDKNNINYLSKIQIFGGTEFFISFETIDKKIYGCDYVLIKNGMMYCHSFTVMHLFSELHVWRTWNQ